MVQITTIHGLMDEELLERKVGSDENDSEIRNWVEYWYEGELVHRSVHLHMKQGLDLFGEAAVLT